MLRPPDYSVRNLTISECRHEQERLSAKDVIDELCHFGHDAAFMSEQSKSLIYFDHAASMPMNESTMEAFLMASRGLQGNPSAAHKMGKKAAAVIESAREILLDAGQATSHYHFVFTSSATEGLNTLINGLSFETISYFDGDHPAVIQPLRESQGKVAEEADLFVLTWVNGQTGAVNDISALAKQIKDKNPKALIVVDGVQGFGKLPLDLSDGMIDALVISGHKAGAPKGIAGIYLKKDCKMKALLLGGGQEHGYRSSTQPTELIFTLGEVVKQRKSNIENDLDNVFKIREFLIDEMKNIFPKVILPFKNEENPYVTSFVFPGLPSDVLMRTLEEENVIVSSTSACSSRIKGKNPTLSALGLDEKFHKNVLRISLSWENTLDEGKEFISRFKNIMNEIGFLIK